MLARTLILFPAVCFVIAMTTGVLIRTRRKQEDKLRREVFRHVCKLEDELSRRMTAKD
jgi:signal transduction histidine kinase